jgi:hypothetical protein
LECGGLPPLYEYAGPTAKMLQPLLVRDERQKSVEDPALASGFDSADGGR